MAKQCHKVFGSSVRNGKRRQAEISAKNGWNVTQSSSVEHCITKALGSIPGTVERTKEKEKWARGTPSATRV